MTLVTQDAVCMSPVSPQVVVAHVLGKAEVGSSILPGGTSTKRLTPLMFPESGAAAFPILRARIMRKACGQIAP